VAGDDAQRALLRRFLAGSLRRPPSFWRALSAVAAEVHERVERMEDGVHIVTLEGGVLSEATAASATQRICEGSHRLATAEEVKEWRRRAAA
jgi:hypothetical protein